MVVELFLTAAAGAVVTAVVPTLAGAFATAMAPILAVGAGGRKGGGANASKHMFQKHPPQYI